MASRKKESATPALGTALTPAGFRHGMAQANGIRVHYVQGGAGAPLVLLHGFPEAWFQWRRVMPALASRFTVIAPDLRGAGATSRPDDGYDKRTMAEDIRALLVHLDLGGQPVYLAGHDIGMMVAYAYAAANPEGVRRLALLDGALPGIEPFWTEIRLNPRTWHFGFHAEVALAATLVRGQERQYLASFHERFAHQEGAFAEPEIQESVRAYSAPGALTASFRWYAAFPEDAEDNQESAERELRMPVLALGGERSMGPMMVPMAQAVAEQVTGGSLPECGHWLAQEQPEALARALLDFFARS
ncbi:MAG TPA: alpha/beta hydrolase [Candidatus Nanopelagicales bacterium]|nr:alpha/beta hydrolase [Candidatus Nanopelagicales bacterium]